MIHMMHMVHIIHMYMQAKMQEKNILQSERTVQGIKFMCCITAIHTYVVCIYMYVWKYRRGEFYNKTHSAGDRDHVWYNGNARIYYICIHTQKHTGEEYSTIRTHSARYRDHVSYNGATLCGLTSRALRAANSRDRHRCLDPCYYTHWYFIFPLFPILLWPHCFSLVCISSAFSCEPQTAATAMAAWTLVTTHLFLFFLFFPFPCYPTAIHYIALCFPHLFPRAANSRDRHGCQEPYYYPSVLWFSFLRPIPHYPVTIHWFLFSSPFSAGRKTAATSIPAWNLINTHLFGVSPSFAHSLLTPLLYIGLCFPPFSCGLQTAATAIVDWNLVTIPICFFSPSFSRSLVSPFWFFLPWWVAADSVFVLWILSLFPYPRFFFSQSCSGSDLTNKNCGPLLYLRAFK